MPDTAIDPIPKQGKFRRALAAVGAWLQALDYTGFDYTLDRTERLERELAQLKEELRQSREASSSVLTPVAPSTSNINDRLQCRRHLKAEEVMRLWWVTHLEVSTRNHKAGGSRVAIFA